MNRLIVFAGIAACLEISCSTVSSKRLDIGVLQPLYRGDVNRIGDSDDERDITVGSDDAHRISDWLSTNQKGWTRTYAPGRMVRGDSFSLSFRDDVCVINCPHGQFYKRVDASEIESIFEKEDHHDSR